MQSRPSPRVLLAALVLVVGIGAGCRSQPAETPAPSVVTPRLLDCRELRDEPSSECQHVWQQVDVHGYTRMREGLPSVELCSVLGCAKCGQVKHECQQRSR